METLTTFDDAFSIIANHMVQPGHETIPVRQALRHVLATDAVARIDVPPFSRSMMDGFAVHEQDLAKGQIMTFSETTAAGDAPGLPVSKGHAVRVMTGAPVPDGASSVIRDEWCETIGPSQIRVLRSAEPGESIQVAGDDGRKGQVLVKRGKRLTELDVSVLQTFGVAEVTVTKGLSAAVIVTGTELVQDINQELGIGQIYGTNDTLLRGALEADGIQVDDITYIPDNLNELEEAVLTAAKKHQLVLITGGASVGDFDYTLRVMQQLGNTVHLRKVLMRPGSPFIFATNGNTAFFGLSGNPAACFAQFSVLVRPAIHLAQGQADSPFPHTGILSHKWSAKPIKHTRVTRASIRLVDGKLMVDCGLAQSSGVISSLGETDVYIRLDGPEHDAGSVVPLRFARWSVTP